MKGGDFMLEFLIFGGIGWIVVSVVIAVVVNLPK